MLARYTHRGKANGPALLAKSGEKKIEEEGGRGRYNFLQFPTLPQNAQIRVVTLHYVNQYFNLLQ